ncbi:hypothetical protein GGR56DRAFT_666354 [Xylariaceae sp. FL0804]|nr:hypothetical protein GGR56DRAFT_666354 [Xylariaceae sp. FL0804]
MSNQRQPTCLSSEPHPDNIKDPLYHYFGCLSYWERSTFFGPDNGLWKDKIFLMKSQGKLDPVDRQRQEWKARCQGELNRNALLRCTLEKDGEEKHLIQSIKKSGAAWKNSDEFKRNIESVRRWRDGKGRKNGPAPDGLTVTLPQETSYDPEKDINVGFMQFQNSKWKDAEDEAIMGIFPDQKIKIKDFLNGGVESQKHVLYRDRFPNTINYFHLPSNNMVEAIARYYGQSKPVFDTNTRRTDQDDSGESQLILKNSHWRGQLHGGNISSRSRFLRPLCETAGCYPVPGNIVLFMPYLHWETSRQREHFAQVIEDTTYQKECSLQGEKDKARCERQNDRSELPRCEFKPAKESAKELSWKKKFIQRLQSHDQAGADRADLLLQSDSSCLSRTNSPSILRKRGKILTLATAVERLQKLKNQLPVDKHGRVQVENKLGQYLIDAARVYEGMRNYRDKQLLRKFLCNDPPLHPRRTLDQAYYWSLNTTKSRDRDQVVYRATTVPSGDFHSFDATTGKWEGHDDSPGKPCQPCQHCTSNIRRLSRIVMVDQLWMWILDSHTIITCFPKRYGVNKADPSGIHKSIRRRVGQGRHNQIKSVFDLALIILDECSNVLFDRTRTTDDQPQVLEAFSEAIGNIMNKQTVAFERLWRWTQRAREFYTSKTTVDPSGWHVALLDINPEGELEREINDIVEELGIMIHINRIHRDTLKQFINHVFHILDPDGKIGERHQRPRTPLNRLNGSMDWKEKSPSELETYNWFKNNAEELTAKVSDRIEQLEELQRSAKGTADSVKDLLELKQQQAGVVQANQSVKQSHEAIRQGRSIMMFTIVTIIFLPLSFMTSVFGMNASEFTGSGLSLQHEFRYIFPISTGIIIVALFFSLSAPVRDFCWFALTQIVTTICVHTPLYRWSLDMRARSQALYAEGSEDMERLKRGIAQLRLERRRRRREAEEQKHAASRARANAAADEIMRGGPDGEGEGGGGGGGEGRHRDTFSRAFHSSLVSSSPAPSPPVAVVVPTPTAPASPISSCCCSAAPLLSAAAAAAASAAAAAA